jgi:hypothetical protein
MARLCYTTADGANELRRRQIGDPIFDLTSMLKNSYNTRVQVIEIEQSMIATTVYVERHK